MTQTLRHILIGLIVVLGGGFLAIGSALAVTDSSLMERPPLDRVEPGTLEIALFGLG